MTKRAGDKLNLIQGELQGDKDARHHAIDVLRSVDRYPEALVEELASDLMRAVRVERNQLYVRRGWAELERMANYHPPGVVQVLPDIVEEMSERANPQDNQDFTDDEVLKRGTIIITLVAQGTDQHIDLDVSRLHTLLHDPATDWEVRSAIYLLLGQKATVEAIEELTSAYEWEVPDARGAIETAIDHACSIVIDSIAGEGGLPMSDAVPVISHLYESAEGIIPVTDGELRENIPNLVANVDPDISGKTSELLLIFARESGEAAEAICEELVQQQLEDPNGARARVIARFLSEHPGTTEDMHKLMPSPSESELIESWPDSMDSETRSLLVGLEPSTTAPIAEVEIRRRMRLGDAPNLPLVLLEYLEYDDRPNLSRLYRNLTEGRRPDESVVEEKVSKLFVGLSSSEEEIRVQAQSIAKSLVDWHPEVSKLIIKVSMDHLVSSERLDKDGLYDILDESASTSPKEFLEQLASNRTLLRESTDVRTGHVLGMVETAAKSSKDVPPELGPPILTLLESNDTRLVLSAIDAVVAMGFYPSPPKLTELSDSDTTRVSTAATRAVRKIRRNHSPAGISRTLELGVDIELFGESEAGLYLKQRDDSGIWCTPDIDHFCRDIIKTVIDHSKRGDNAPVVYPYFQPKDIVILTVALTISNIESDPNIVLFSPGSQTQWGMKGEIRDELERFALSGKRGQVSDATPLPEVVPHAYISQGEVKNKSDGNGPGRIILSKSPAEIAEVDDIEFCVVNLVSRTTEELDDELVGIESANPKTNFVNAYSYYVRNEGDGRPRYGPPEGLAEVQTIPGSDLIEDLLTDHGDETGDSSRLDYRFNHGDKENSVSNGVAWRMGPDDVHRLSKPTRIRIENVSSPDLEVLFDKLFQISAELRDVDDQGAGSLIFSRHLFFERLPVTTSSYDEWVRERYYAGEHFVPPLIDERIGDVREKSKSVENLEAVQPLDSATKLLERISNMLENENPLAEHLEQHIEDARSTGSRIVLLSESPKHAQILRSDLVERDVVEPDELDKGLVSIVHPDRARSIEPCDRLIVFGALHPENAGFYILPQAEETVVLTYDRTWADMVDRHATEFVNRLNDAVGGEGFEPYAEPVVCGDLEEKTAESPQHDEEPITPKSPPIPDMEIGRQSSRSEEPELTGKNPKLDYLTEAMELSLSSEYQEESSRYDYQLRHLVIESQDGSEIETNNHDRFLKRRSSGEGSWEYHWVGPDMLSPGDEFVTIPDEIETEMWLERLSEIYSDDLEADATVSGLETWCESVERLWSETVDRLETQEGDSPADIDVAREIHGELKRNEPGFDRNLATVRGWFESVLEANRPLELAERPELVIGPRDYHDIEAIGRTFHIDRLLADAKEIEGAMRGLRTINRQEGSQYRDSIREKMNAGINNKVRESATIQTVKEVRELDV